MFRAGIKTLGWVRRHRWLVVTCGVCLAVVAMFVATLFIPLVGKLCEYSEEARKSECAYHHVGPFAVFWLGVIIDEHNGLVTALATAIMAVFTGTLWIVTGKAVSLARAEFSSTHRPKFKIRKVTFSQLFPDVPISGHCDVVNVGDMPGELVEFCVEIICGTPGERYEYWLPNPKNVRQFNTPLAVGESGTIWFTDGRDLPQSMYEGIKSRNMVAYVFGYVGYADGAKLRRNTGLLRWYDASYARFRTINDPDYEYED